MFSYLHCGTSAKPPATAYLSLDFFALGTETAEKHRDECNKLASALVSVCVSVCVWRNISASYSNRLGAFLFILERSDTHMAKRDLLTLLTSKSQSENDKALSLFLAALSNTGSLFRLRTVERPHRRPFTAGTAEMKASIIFWRNGEMAP